MTKKQLICRILCVVLTVTILVGSVGAIFLLETDHREEMVYYTDTNSIDYYGDEYGKQCAIAFRSALKNYINSKITDYLSLEDDIDAFCKRVIQAMSDGRVPAIRLKVMAEIIRNNSFNNLLSKVSLSLENNGNIYTWIENTTANVASQSIFSVLCSFVEEFLEATTLTEDELSRAVYYYLLNNADDTYRGYLALFGEEYFVNLLSDSLFVVTKVQKINDSQGGIMASMSALRSALFQLGSVYLKITEISGNVLTFEKVLGLPTEFPQEKFSDADRINERYATGRGSSGYLMFFLGTLLTDVTENALQSYFAYLREKEKYAEEYTALQIKENKEIITDEEIAQKKALEERFSVLRILAMEQLSPLLRDGAEQLYPYLNISSHAETIEYITSVLTDYREVILLLGDTENADYETLYEEYELNIETIEKYTNGLENALEALSRRSDTEETVLSLTESERAELAEYGEKVENVFDLLAIYCNSVMNIWLYYGVGIRGDYLS